MKLKVKVIQVNLKGNKVANSNEVIDSSQLPDPDIAEKLIEDGYFELVESDENDDNNLDDNDEVTEEYLDELKKKELIAFAEENEIEINKSENKGFILNQVKSALGMLEDDDDSEETNDDDDSEE